MHHSVNLKIIFLLYIPQPPAAFCIMLHKTKTYHRPVHHLLSEAPGTVVLVMCAKKNIRMKEP
jgi:hypothetical protein